MQEKNDTLWKEADEDLQRERLEKLWQDYGTYLIGALVAMVLAIGGYKYNESRKIARAEAAGDSLAIALRDAATPPTQANGLQALAIAARSADGAGLLARIRLAAADAEAGKTAEALAAFDRIAAEKADPMLTEYAALRAALLTVDSADWTQTQNRLSKLTADGKAWRHSARELLAVAALKAGDTSAAMKELERLLGDKTAPQALLQRAQTLMAVATEREISNATPVTAQPVAVPQPQPPAPAVGGKSPQKGTK